jgi:hypothetical protein
MGNIRSQYGVLGAWSTTMHDPEDPIGVYKLSSGQFLISAANTRSQVHSGCSASIPLKTNLSTVLTSTIRRPLLSMFSWGMTATKPIANVVHSMCYLFFFWDTCIWGLYKM